MSTDAEYMQRAIRLAAKGRYTTDPNPNVGCVIVNEGEIVGEGWHQRAGGPHAEIHALEQAGERARGATVYVTLEPCSHTGKTPPCANALVRAGVKKVIAAMMDPNPLVAGKGLIKLHQAGIETDSGLLEEQARALNPGFIKRMVCGRPYVRVKLAMSLDGRTAMASGESQWITGEAARRDVQYLRAQSSAILTGISTVLYDDPSMNVRLSAEDLGLQDFEVNEVRQPKRIVLDSEHKMLSQARIFASEGESAGGECIVYTTVDVDNKTDYPYTIETITAREGRIDLNALLTDLGKKEINLVHVEAGSVLCGALLQDELVDEIVVYMAPHIMGDGARGLFHLPGLSQMQDRIKLKLKDVRHIGDDIRLTFTPEKIAGRKQ
ncbi:MAG TPA: bifunctional diaminohydroxyphosphoribosylaminopyrimidine deaminase/5-amino-6-(5-phosphoribosylamino)uracil reductase RibD [Gammaproteobacteria bacterium]|nr:bifunctional diaminohydroxyphosphoribosylaminopyrimidine deaminase/5-amino-6-(5-phosphoribosylamino)uracil reductase RibD [Gammaproteobacteria bacterium]